ncbi:MAG: gliding motility-associated-like protein, partial [Granulosicoccus sp.]
ARAIYIPNVFTPNGDGENDIFMIYAGDLSQIKQVNTFMIYDRWGETIFRAADFEPMDPQNGWDGTFKGETLNPQVFVYWAEIEFIDGLKVMYKGDVTLRK